MKKIIIIPLGGLGNRFKVAEYELPKPLINVLGTPIIYWLLKNLDLSDIEYICIPYNKDIKKFRFEDQLRQSFPKINFKFLCLNNNTRGATETIKISLDWLNEPHDKHVMCIDGDNFYTENILSAWDGSNMIFTFDDYGLNPVFSYVQIDKNNNVTQILEKSKISNLACCGVYAFNSMFELLNMCNHVINNNIVEKGEFYLSVVISEMIKNGNNENNGNNFTCNKINLNNYFCLGTPSHVKIFCNKYKGQIESKRYCFDLDNTLVTFPKVHGDYSTVEPIEKNINMLKHLKNKGNTIIIHTARKMKSSNGNIGKVMQSIGKITIDTLEKFDIPYDELYFGKPYADYYIDDLAVSSYSNLEKNLGYHQTCVEPRIQNNIETEQFEIIKKTSLNLAGEIHYYNNIPHDIKKYFPIFINYDTIHNTWYQIEKINGISVSKLYLAMELPTELLKNIMNIISEIQSYSGNITNIYANYKNKVIKRYAQYDYSKYPKSNELYNELLESLEFYENNDLGNCVMIHGDPNFTNILLSGCNELKFIDMRGQVGDELTIYGDWLYDWSKIYQSIIGYDEILDNIIIDSTYKNMIINFFETEFLKKYSKKDLANLKIITKSLLFTLIPLHDNNKCIEYYNLIFSDYLK